MKNNTKEIIKSISLSKNRALIILIILILVSTTFNYFQSNTNSQLSYQIKHQEEIIKEYNRIKAKLENKIRDLNKEIDQVREKIKHKDELILELTKKREELYEEPPKETDELIDSFTNLGYPAHIISSN